MKKASIILFSLILLLISGCDPIPKRSEYVKEPFAPRITADESLALIYFMRETPIINLGAGDYILEDGKLIGIMLGGTYFIRKLPPGKYSFWADAMTPTILVLTVKAGETYYIEGVPRNPSLELREITKPLADKLMVGMQYTQLTKQK